MATTRRRQSSPTLQRARSAAGTHIRRILSDWFTLTFAQDRQKLVGPLTPTLLNWLFLAAFTGYTYVAGFSVAAFYVLAGWLAATLVRAAYVQGRRRKQIASIYAALAQVAKLPTGTASQPADPAQSIRKVRWGAKALPERFTVTLNASAPAANAPLLRGSVETIVEAIPSALSGSGGEWLCTWNQATVTAEAVPTGDQRLTRKNYQRKITALIVQIFKVPATPSGSAGWEVSVKDWDVATTADGGQADYPTGIAVRCADRDLSDPALRDHAERQIERAVPIPGEWLFTWDPATSSLSVDHAAADSLDARRKRTQRRMNDDMAALVPTRGKDPVVLDVVEWVNPEMDLPRSLHVNFGTLALDDPRTRDQIEDRFDSAVATRWDKARALFEWRHGAITELDITLVSHNDPRALQRAALTRFRNVTNAKFGSARNPVTTEVLDWQEGLSAAGTALPQKARVNFGTVDVTKPETRDSFQDHWDSIDDNNDWHYDWNTPEGYVEMNAVPKLAVALAFPNPDEELHDTFMRFFREGKIILGPQKGGGWFVWDLNKVPHGLIGGRTGAGKSVQLDIILYLILMNRDMSDIVVCDPKMTDFTWTPEFPNVVRFAAGVLEICTAIDWIHGEMERRQQLLNKRGVRNMKYLRALYREHPEFEAEDGPAPKRLFLLFDEIANFLGASANKDVEELKTRAREQLESIGQLSRAMEINMIVAAQKPEAKYVSTQLKQMMELRECVGPVDEYTSKQILESTHGTRFGEGTPKGRAWAWTSEQGFQVVQVPYLPSATEPAPWDPSITIEGSKDRLRSALADDGWVQMFRPNADGGQAPYWVRVEDDDEPAELAPDRKSDRLPIGLPGDAGDAYLAGDDEAEQPVDAESRVELTDDLGASDPFAALDEELPWEDTPPWDVDDEQAS